MSDPETRPQLPRTGQVRAGSGKSEIDAFIKDARNLAVASTAHDRIILALDATMSRQPTWDLACSLQGDMFDAVGKSGRLSIQLAYFRGLSECRTSRFVTDTNALKALMQKISCQGGTTQISRILKHAVKETKAEKVQALVFIGDAMEENVDELASAAGALGLAGTPVFIFQEGQDGAAELAFKEIARLSRGAWFRFDHSAADRLAALLSAVAVYASGGLTALEARGRKGDRLLLQHLGGSR
jgi:hypothetical protein